MPDSTKSPAGARRPTIPAEDGRHRRILHWAVDVYGALDRAALVSVAPISSLLPPIEGAVAVGLYAALFGLAVLAVVAPEPRWWVASFLAIVAVFCLADQTRWQPWVFQYSFLLVVVGLCPWARATPDGQRRLLNIARLIVAFTDIFSGLQKINLNFMENDFPWMVTPITNLLPSASGFLLAFGFAAPFIQVAFGVGLLTQRYRASR